MEHNLQHTISLLTRTPATLNALLRDLPEAWTIRNEGENTWSACEVVAHLIYGERTDWMPRAWIILQFGETRAFQPFERAGHVRESQGKALPQLLDEFARMRSESPDQLRALNLRREDLERRGRHPAFGPVTLSQHLASWAAHDLTHLHQISRIMAHQYREAVGPWSAFCRPTRTAGLRRPPLHDCSAAVPEEITGQAEDHQDNRGEQKSELVRVFDCCVYRAATDGQRRQNKPTWRQL